MTKEEYKAKIAEIDKQEAELKSQRMKTNKEFSDSLLKELEEQGITPGTKVLVKIKYGGKTRRLRLKLTSSMFVFGGLISNTFSTKQRKTEQCHM